MSPREKATSWLASNFIAILLYAITLAVGAATLKAEVQALDLRVDAKADHALVREVLKELRSLKVLACRDYPDDSQCIELSGR